MKNNLIILVLALTVIIAAFTSVSAQDKPIQLALFAPVQIYNENTSITGIRLNFLYGRNTSVTGLDWGLVNHCTGGKSSGIQLGFIGLVDGDFSGFQDNFINSTKKDFRGWQWGFVNYANSANGFQLGVVNYAVTMKGLQIGLINVIKQGGQFPIFPIVNWSF
jgi:hypothetical protein